MKPQKPALFAVIAVILIGGALTLIGGHDHHHHEHEHNDAAAEAEADATQDGIAIYEPRIFALPPGAKVTAGFGIIVNGNENEKVLLSATADFSGRTEIHATREEDGIAKMRPLPDGLPIGGGDTAVLAPGGLHVMFFDIDSPPQVGATEAVVLHFSGGTALTVNFPVAEHGHDGHAHRH